MDQLFEVLGRQDIQAAIMLGFILGVAIQFFLGFLTLPFGPDKARIKNQVSVSYTHLTLPTIYSV